MNKCKRKKKGEMKNEGRVKLCCVLQILRKISISKVI